jgi:adenosylcobinamide-GDP ribazoletransferase
MRNLISFFSRIPVKGQMEKARDELWLLPIFGLFTSAIPSAFIFLELPLKGIISVVSLYLIIGIIHLDGLADFFDGLMAKGGKNEKIKVMRSPEIGVAGVFVVLMILLIQIFSIESLTSKTFWILSMAEVNSKMSIALVLRKNNFIQGIGEFFAQRMDPKRLLATTTAYFACLIFISAIGRSILAFILVISLFAAIWVERVSIKNFGGLSGDCIGASAEITRTLSLLLGVLLWKSLR